MLDFNYTETITLKSGKQVTLRFPQPGDVEAMLEFVNEMADEDTYTSMNRKFSYEEELDYLVNLIKKQREGKEINRIVYEGDRYLGAASVRSTDPRQEHVGRFGIALRKEVRGQGLGKILVEKICAMAKDEMKLSMLILDVYAPNTMAINLYKNMGFVEYGRLPKAVKYKDELIDKILMYKDL